MARLHLHPIGLVFLFLGLVSWVVALGGLAASTKDCMSNTPSGAPAGYCGNSYQLEWWSIWLELFILVPMTLCSFLAAFDRMRSIFLTFLSIATVLLTLMARAFITNSFAVGGVNFGNYQSDAYNAAAAGGVMLCIVNYVLILILGLGAPRPAEATPPPTYAMPTSMNQVVGNMNSALGNLGIGLGANPGMPGADKYAPTAQYQQPGAYTPQNF